jgi:inward rectifier potassium channel
MPNAKTRASRFSLSDARTPWHLLWNEPISMLVRMPWPLFLLTVVALFALQMSLFWLLFYLDPTGIDGADSMGLPRVMVYSLQNLLGASFGTFAPTSTYALSLSALECLAGILSTAVVTALFLARLLQTEAPLIFSKQLCLSSLPNGHLFCRFVTHDPSSWLNVRYSLSLFLDVEIETKIWQRKVLQLSLLNAETPQLSLTATITHPIDAESPFRRYSLEQLRRAHALLVYLVEGTDEITGSPLLQIQSYDCDDITLDRKFADLVGVGRKGERRVFIDRLDHLAPVEAAPAHPDPARLT